MLPKCSKSRLVTMKPDIVDMPVEARSDTFPWKAFSNPMNSFGNSQETGREISRNRSVEETARLRMGVLSYIHNPEKE